MNDTIKPNFPQNVICTTISDISKVSIYTSANISFHFLNVAYPMEHYHTHWEIPVILHGSIKHTVNGKEYIQTSGECCVIRPNDRHKLSYVNNKNKDYLLLNIAFNCELAKKILSVYTDFDALLNAKENLVFSIPSEDVNLIYNKALMIQGQFQDLYEKQTLLLTERILISFFEHRLTYNNSMPLWINDFITKLKNPNSFTLKIVDIVKDAPYQHSQLSKLFKEYTGLTIKQYINENKMIYSKTLLSSTKMSMLEISEKLGYDSLSSFNHLFIKKFSITPSQYRKKYSILNPTFY